MKYFLIGDRVALTADAQHIRGEQTPIPAGTVGSVVGWARDIPQVDFGDAGIHFVSAHVLELVGLPKDIQLPDDGDTLFSWDVYAEMMRKLAGKEAQR